MARAAAAGELAGATHKLATVATALAAEQAARHRAESRLRDYQGSNASVVELEEANRKLAAMAASLSAETAARERAEMRAAAARDSESAQAATVAGPSTLLPSSDSSQFPSTCSSLPLVFGYSNVAC